MPNTVHGPYTKTTWSQGSTPLNATNMGHLETQADVALNGFNGDLLTPFVLSGLVCSKNGSSANQLDVTSGRAYLAMSDSTIGLIATVASTPGQFITSTPSTTYYLFLKNDGTWQWSTSSTGPANSLQICQATTDGSGNINVVTDKRTTSTTLLSGAAGTPTFNTLDAAHLAYAYGSQFGSYNATVMEPDASVRAGGTTVGQIFAIWNGSALVNVVAIGSTDTRNAPLMISPTGGFNQIASQPTVGSFGVSPIVAQLIDQAVTDTTFHSFTLATVPATGLYRVTAQFYLDAGTARLITLSVSFTQGHSGGATSQAFISNSAAGHGKLWDGTGTGDSAAAGDAPGSSFQLYLSGGTSISVRFQDPGYTTGTDRVNAILERLT